MLCENCRDRICQQEFPKTGLMRLRQVLALIPISKAQWWKGVKEGIYPQPVKLGKRLTAWRAEDIWKLIENGVACS